MVTLPQGVVRKQLGLSFNGEALPYPMIFGDIEIKGVEPNVRDVVSYISTPSLTENTVLAYLGKCELSFVSPASTHSREPHNLKF